MNLYSKNYNQRVKANRTGLAEMRLRKLDYPVDEFPEVTTRSKALHRNLKFYYTGKPCKHGHICERYTKQKTCLACHSEYRERYERDPEKYVAGRLKNRAWRDNCPEKRILYSARERAKKKGLEFSIVLEDIVIPERCPVFGCLLVVSSGQGIKYRDFAPSLDRIDNTKGYEKGNIAVISNLANKYKSDMSREQLQQLAAWWDKQLELHRS